MVAVMGVMFFVHKAYGNKHKPGPQDPLDVLKVRFARGEIGREEYEERRAVLAASAPAAGTRSVARSAWPP